MRQKYTRVIRCANFTGDKPIAHTGVYLHVCIFGACEFKSYDFHPFKLNRLVTHHIYPSK